jgi:hypothetical protein
VVLVVVLAVLLELVKVLDDVVDVLDDVDDVKVEEELLDDEEVCVSELTVAVVVSQSSSHASLVHSVRPSWSMHNGEHTFLHTGVEVVEDAEEVNVDVFEVAVPVVDVSVNEACVEEVRVGEVLVEV